MKSQTRQMYTRYAGGMEEWKLKLALARLARFRVPTQAWEDTMQELAVVIHEFRFKPEKAHAASERTVLCRKLDNRIRMLARSNARAAANLDRIGQMSQSVEDDQTLQCMAIQHDVQQLLATLTRRQQRVCQALMAGQSIAQIARAAGVHYTTIRREIERIRRVFSEGGFDTWCG